MKGFLQVPVAMADRKRWSLQCPSAFPANADAIGSKEAPAMFQWMVDQLLEGLNDFASAYVDDVIVYSLSWKDHLCHLCQELMS